MFVPSEHVTSTLDISMLSGDVVRRCACSVSASAAVSLAPIWVIPDSSHSGDLVAGIAISTVSARSCLVVLLSVAAIADLLNFLAHDR